MFTTFWVLFTAQFDLLMLANNIQSYILLSLVIMLIVCQVSNTLTLTLSICFIQEELFLVSVSAMTTLFTWSVLFGGELYILTLFTCLD